MAKELKPTFDDANGVSWTMKVTIATQIRVREETTYNLLELAEPESELLKLCASNQFVMFQILCAVLRPQIAERFGEGEQADIQFGESLDEQSSQDAVLALMDGLFLFFGVQKRALLKGAHDKVVSAHNRMTAKALAMAEEALNSPTIDAEIEKALETALNVPSGSTPASSAGSPVKSAS